MAQKKILMKWTPVLEEMLVTTDILDIDGDRLLKINSTGTQGNFPLEMLKDEVHMVSKQTPSVLAVNQKVRSLRKRQHTDETMEAQEPAQPVAAVEPVPRPVTGGKCPGKLEIQKANYRIKHSSDEPEPRPVTGGKGVPTMRTGWLRSGQHMPKRLLVILHYAEAVEQGEQVLTTNTEQVAPQQVQNVFKNREEERVAKRIKKALALQHELPSNEADMEIELLNSSEMVAGQDKLMDDMMRLNFPIHTPKPDDGFDSDMQQYVLFGCSSSSSSLSSSSDDESYTEEEMKTVNRMLAECQANRTKKYVEELDKKYVQELDELIVLCQLQIQAQAAAAAVSPQRVMSPSNEAAATYARILQNEDFIQELAATANEAAPRVMSPSNGAAATAAPAGPRMVDEKHFNEQVICNAWGLIEMKRDEYEIKLNATAACFHEMAKLGVISLRLPKSGEERSVFGITGIVVNSRLRFVDIMTEYAKTYTKEVHKETKNYQASLYHNFLDLGFNPIQKDKDAWKVTGRKRIHICFHSWNYTEAAFQKHKGRYIGR